MKTGHINEYLRLVCRRNAWWKRPPQLRLQDPVGVKRTAAQSRRETVRQFDEAIPTAATRDKCGGSFVKSHAPPRWREGNRKGSAEVFGEDARSSWEQPAWQIEVKVRPSVIIVARFLDTYLIGTESTSDEPSLNHRLGYRFYSNTNNILRASYRARSNFEKSVCEELFDGS